MIEKPRRTPLTAEQHAERRKRLGLTVDPDYKAPRPYHLSKRYKRELDEITFSKPNPNKTDNNK
jgi:hypothetical protein